MIGGLHDAARLALGVRRRTFHDRILRRSDAFSIQGFHSPNLMVVLSEAHGIPQDQIDSVKRLNPSSIVMTGNPLISRRRVPRRFP